ncbi:alcohol oxidase [Exidia glandulosa HHB12029]|uniref:Alcohol oxidase n=1 Tax=Exidia glandulosa HHB12029 TaxID=1314781 RepID=A0A165MRM6_EXIGL|nr:alcohol oxidase [Exidia glandulosa HHB12029]
MADTYSHTADIIIVGAGVAGCVIASRLSAAQPNLKILLIEMGRDVRDDPAVRTPGIFMNNLVPGAPYSQFYVGEPSETQLGNSAIIPAGACVGGGSAINWMVYTRGSMSDYDDWKNKYANPGWGFDDLLPLFKKSEAYFGEGDASTHGSDGPLQVTYGGIVYKINLEWLETASAFDGRPVVPDAQNFKTSNAFARWAKWIGKDGKRSDIAHGYLYPQMDRSSNITLLTKTRVSRVLFEGNKAVGVEYFTSASDPPTLVRAAKMVIVTAGALSTPQILERSGIGARVHLDSLGISVVADLPRVGEGYQDHLVLKAEYVREPDDSWREDVLRGTPEVMERLRKEYAEYGTGELASNSIDAVAKVRPNEKELAALGETFINSAWPYFERAEDKPVLWSAVVGSAMFPGGFPSGQYFATGGWMCYPLSRGRIHVRSKDVFEAGKFEPGLLSHEADVAAGKWLYKRGREQARRMPSYRGEYAPMHPDFSADSEAACKAGLGVGPVPLDAPEIVYTPEDEKVLEEWIRKTVTVSWHGLATCAMRPRADGGVVSPRLDVYGTKQLKVADLSICPSNVSANMYSTAVAMGEKAAQIILEDLVAVSA